jgi:vesicle-associated membrane protein 2
LYKKKIINFSKTEKKILNQSFPHLPPPPNSSSGSQPQNKRLQQTQQKVDEVVGIMRVNVEKVLERDQKLSELDHRADALQHGASQFEQQAGKLKRKQWWANVKMMIIMGIIGVVLLIIIIGELKKFSFLFLRFLCFSLGHDLLFFFPTSIN